MILTLIGYRGSGKTSVAVALHSRLGWPCADADQVLQARAGCTIREIFERHGELYFRDLEEQVLAEMLAGKDFTDENCIVSAGGGAILRESTRQRMRQSGPVVWLEASATELARRIAEDVTSPGQRPELTNLGLVGEVATVLNNRLPLYEATATHRVSTEGKTPDEIADEIATTLHLLKGA